MRFYRLADGIRFLAPHWPHIARRVLYSLATFWAVTIVFFVIAELMPGDFATATATRDTTQEDIVLTRYQLGLYAPALDRYIDWIAALAQGDLGISWWTRTPITPLLVNRLAHSGWLVGWAVLITVPLGLGLAIAAVAFWRGLFDRISGIVSLTAISVPEFVVGYGLMALLAVEFRVFPVYTVFNDELSILERLHASALPILSLAAVAIVPIFRQVRAALINVLKADYIEMARLKGLGRWRITLWHAVPNAIAPIANSVLLTVANLFFGLIVIEMVFGYPGVGFFLITAVGHQDMPVVLACSLITAALYIGFNLAADLVSAIWNPRLRRSSDQGAVTLWRARMGAVWILRRWPVILLLIVLAIPAWLGVQWFQSERRYAVDDQIHVPLPASETRDKLTVAELTRDLALGAMVPIHYAYFQPFGPDAGPARHVFEGTVHIPRFLIRRQRVGDRSVAQQAAFPTLETSFVTDGDTLLPIERDRLLSSERRGWHLILSAGRIWHEPRDGDWSRAAFPFTLTGTHGMSVHYGVATFLFNDRDMSRVRIQVSQETANWAQYDLWGQGKATYLPAPVPGADAARAAYRRVLESRVEMRPWSELASRHWRSLEGFDGDGNRQNIAVSGLMLDDIFYLRPCRTRAGPHPFCREVRFGVFSISKSIGAAVALFWLAEKYGPTVLDERLVDFIEIPAAHDGWRDVTFRNALDMTTGIGDLLPYIVDEYVEVDDSGTAIRVWNARSIGDKLAAMATFKNYPWGPGKVTRYRSSDTTALTAAMEAYLREREGPNADLWDRLTQEVFLPLGIDRLPVRRSEEPDGRRGTPLLAGGMYVTIDDAVKLARLFQDHGEHHGRQLIHRDLAARAVSVEMDRGFRTGWRTREGGEAHYELSFWLNHHPPSGDCEVRIPGMSGYGGNYLIVMPNRSIGLRFADGHDDDVYTWDNYGIRRISEQIRPFCE